MLKEITIKTWLGERFETNVIQLFPANGGRKDQYRAVMNGKPWKAKISASQLFSGLRKSR